MNRAWSTRLLRIRTTRVTSPMDLVDGELISSMYLKSTDPFFLPAAFASEWMLPIRLSSLTWPPSYGLSILKKPWMPAVKSSFLPEQIASMKAWWCMCFILRGDFSLMRIAFFSPSYPAGPYLSSVWSLRDQRIDLPLSRCRRPNCTSKHRSLILQFFVFTCSIPEE